MAPKRTPIPPANCTSWPLAGSQTGPKGAHLDKQEKPEVDGACARFGGAFNWEGLCWASLCHRASCECGHVCVWLVCVWRGASLAECGGDSNLSSSFNWKWPDGKWAALFSPTWPSTRRPHARTSERASRRADEQSSRRAVEKTSSREDGIRGGGARRSSVHCAAELCVFNLSNSGQLDRSTAAPASSHLHATVQSRWRRASARRQICSAHRGTLSLQARATLPDGRLTGRLKPQEESRKGDTQTGE